MSDSGGMRVEVISERSGKTISLHPTKVDLMVDMFTFMREHYNILEREFTVSNLEFVEKVERGVLFYDKFDMARKGRNYKFGGHAILLKEDGKLYLYTRKNAPAGQEGWTSTKKRTSFGEAVVRFELSPHKLLHQFKENVTSISPVTDVYFSFLDWVMTAAVIEARKQKLREFTPKSLNSSVPEQ